MNIVYKNVGIVLMREESHSIYHVCCCYNKQNLALGCIKMGDNITIYMVCQNHPVCSAPKEL
jgi:hypothetical protein